MKELDVIKLISAFENIPVGTKGTIVHMYNEKCVEVEFIDVDGNTIDVVTTPVDILEIVSTFDSH